MHDKQALSGLLKLRTMIIPPAEGLTAREPEKSELLKSSASKIIRAADRLDMALQSAFERIILR